MGRTAVLAAALWAGIIIWLFAWALTQPVQAAVTISETKGPVFPWQTVIVDFFRPPSPPIGRDRTPQRIGSPGVLPSRTSSITGKASWYASWCNCNAMTDQRWRGQKVLVKGPIGSVTVTINDAGPVKGLHRVADLNPTVFRRVCGTLSRGICVVTITGP